MFMSFELNYFILSVSGNCIDRNFSINKNVRVDNNK